METRWNYPVCTIMIDYIGRYSDRLVKDITANCHRSGTSQTYTVPNADNSAVGSYTCMVTVSTVASSESSGYSLTATGSLVFESC